VVVAKDEAVDIDTEEDWRIAEKLFLLRSYPKIKID
jgi:CMP-N-acetylneuraminic acid synthetase